MGKKHYFLQRETLKDKEGWSIRYSEKIDGKWKNKRYPKKLYKSFEDDVEKLESLVARLNGRDEKKEAAKKAWDQASVFVNLGMKEKFQKFVIDELSSESEGKKYFNMFQNYSLPFLTGKSPDPLDWLKYQRAWKQHLLGLGKSSNTLKRIVRTTNLYFEFLSLEFPDEIPQFLFKPFKKSDHKNNEAKRTNKRESKYISKSDYRQIEKRLPDELRSIVIISKNYGLRLAEALGLFGRVEEVLFEDSLYINKQLKSNSPVKYKPTKTREVRDIPHFFIDPEELYDLIENLDILSVWSASRKFSVFCDNLKKDGLITDTYTFHDLRHTFITDIAQHHGAYEAQQAAGHSRLSTTDGYVHRIKKSKRTPFKKAS